MTTSNTPCCHCRITSDQSSFRYTSPTPHPHSPLYAPPPPPPPLSIAITKASSLKSSLESLELASLSQSSAIANPRLSRLSETRIVRSVHFKITSNFQSPFRSAFSNFKWERLAFEFDCFELRNRCILLGFRETLEGGIALVGMRNPRMGADGQCWNNGIGFYCVEGEVPVILFSF
ncbi:hypothetical protein Droror1_Dr00011561 [Drosera rotundifolia]